MSKQVDERVVSMQFDNKHFESNVQTTMSTLDKLKQKLNLSGASKGLKDINAAAKKTDMSVLANGVETVRAKFSALQVMGVTALANITNSAVNAGKRIAHSLTIQPITTGFNEYELKMNSIQTIMASTGEKLSTVNNYLEELNAYSDKTIYSFSDMTQNIGKFTNAGVKLEDAVMAIKGISNEAAVSGANANEASRAMYNFAQALSAGYVKLIDWKSIELANMATKEFKEQLIQSAVAAGTLTETSDGMYKTLKGNTLTATKNFNETLSDQWMTTEVLIGTLKDYADENTKIGKKAFAAAQDVKTFSMMLDTLKESAQSGWAKTWEIMFGDLEEAKTLWTGLTNFIGGFIDKMSDARNTILESALGKSFSKLKDQISSINKPLGKAAKSVEKVTKVAKDYSKVVDEIIKGDWGNTEKRWNALTKAGYDWAHAQNLVNEKLGYSKRYTTEYDDSQKKLNKTQKESKETNAELIAKHAEMSDAQLKNLGYTDKQIQAFRDLADAADRIGMPLEEFIKNIDEIDGRWLIINSFKNIWEEVSKIFEKVGEAWKNVFGESTIEDKANSLYDLIEKFHKFTESLEISEETAEKFKNVMEGLFSAFQLTHSVLSMSALGALKILNELLKLFDMGSILDVAEKVANWIKKINDYVQANYIFAYGKAWENIATILKAVIEGITKVLKALWSLTPVQKIITKIKDAFSELFSSFDLKGFDVYSIVGAIDKFFGKIKTWVKSLENSENIGKDLIQGLINGIWSGIQKLGSVLWDLGATIIDTIKSILGIHSPSTVMIAIGGFIIAGLLKGLQNGEGTVLGFFKNFGLSIFDLVSTIGLKIIDFIKDLDLGKVFAIAIASGVAIGIAKFINIMDKFGDAAKGIGNLCSGVGKLASDLGDRLNPKKNKFKEFATAVLELAVAIGILAASVYLLAQLDAGKLWSAIGALAALAAIVVALAFAASKIDTSSGGFGKLSLALIGITASLYIMASAIKKLEFLDSYNIGPILGTLAAMIGGLSLILVMFGKFVKGKAAQNIDKAGWTLVKISAALLLMTFVIKQISKLDPSALKSGLITITAFGLFIVGLMAATRLAGKQIDKVGSTILKISAAMLLLVFVIKMVSKLEAGTLAKGIACITLFGGIIVGLIAATKLAGKDINKIGSTILGISAAMMLMAITVRIVSGMKPAALAKGLIAITLFGGIIVGLIAATRLAGGETKGLALTILAISLAIGILAATAMVLSLISLEGLAKGVTAVVLLGSVMTAMIWATRGASDCKGNLIVMTVAIAIMAAAVALLSSIDGTKLAGATLAMTTMMGMFALMTKVAGQAQKSIGALLVMTLAIGIMAGAIYLLADLKTESALASAASLSLLMIAMSASLAIVSKAGSNVKNALLGVVGLLALCVPLLALVGILALMQNIQNATTNATILAGLATVLSLLLIPLSIVGILVTATGGMALLGIVSLLAMCVPLLALVGILAIMQNIQNATANAQLLIDLMNVLTNTLVILAVVGPLALIGVTAMYGLVALMGVVAVFATAVGALMQQFPALQSFLDTGIPVMVQLAGGIGQMIGAFVGGIIETVATSLPMLGACLGLFMTNAMPFIMGAKLVDSAVLEGVGILAAAILALTVADLIEGIATFLNGGSSFSTLGTELSNFMLNAMPFIMLSKQIDPAIMEGVKTLAEAVLILTGTDILEGLTSWLTGGSSLSDFGAQLGGLGTNLNTFVTNLGTFTDDQVKTVNCAGRAIKALASAASEIPNEGGWLGAIVGENSLASFGAELGALGTNISDFVTNLGTFTEDQVTTVDCAGRAIKALADAAKEIPNDGGWLGAIVGENSLATFGDKLPDLGNNIASFVTNLGTFSEEQVATVKCASDAIKALASAADTIPNEGGFWASIVGDNSLSTFGDKLPGLAEDIKNFVKGLGTFGEGQIATVNSACKAIKVIAALGKIDVKDTASGLEELGEELVDFGENLSDFVSSISDVSGDNITSAVNKVKEVIDLAKTAASTNIDSLKNFGSSLKEAATDGVKGFVNEFASETPKADIKRAATAMMDSFIKGLNDKIDDIEKEAKKVANKAADSIEDVDLESKGETSGKDLGKGLVLGIEAKYTAAYNAGYKLGQKAVQGEKDGQKSKSPSKLTIQAGKWLGEGLVIGIDKMGSAVYNSGKSMGKTAVNSISKAISNISDIVNTDIDSQPTIRPVLDLSDVKSGTNAINGMLSDRKTLSIDTSSVGVISASMSGFQNGNSDDVVSAIKGLQKDISNMPRESIHIDGISYNDDSNISDAVQTLVRAVRIERRV